MKRRVAMVLGALALSGSLGTSQGAEYPYPRPRTQPAAVTAAAPTSLLPTVDVLYARWQARRHGASAALSPAMPAGVYAPYQAEASQFAVDQRAQPAVIQPVQYIAMQGGSVQPEAVPAPTPKPVQLPVGSGPVVVERGMITGAPCCIGEPVVTSSFAVDLGIYVLQPRWDSNPAYRVQGDAGLADARREIDFHADAEIAPLAVVSYVGAEGIGGRIRYWQIESDNRTSATNDGTLLITSAAPLGLNLVSTPGVIAVDEEMLFESDLSITVFDLEGTANLNWNCFTMIVACGARLAHISQSYNVTQFNTVADELASLRSGHNFSGAGPTLAVTVRRPVGDLGLAFYGGLRGSLLYGKTRQSANLAAIDALVFQDAQVNQFDHLPVTELEFGAQFCTPICGSYLFLQAGVIGQTWFGAGNAANNDLLIGVANDNDQANLSLLGLVLTLGLDY